MLLQKIAIYTIIGYILSELGADYTNTLYWCVFVLIILSDYLARKDGFDEGIETAKDILELSNRILDEARKYVDEHTDKIRVEKQDLIRALTAAVNKDKDTLK